jgi:hypothetical protein
MILSWKKGLSLPMFFMILTGFSCFLMEFGSIFMGDLALAGCLLVLDCEKCWAWVALFCWVFWWFACSIGYFFFAFLLFGSNQLIFLSVIRELLVLQLITFRLKTRDKQVCILFSKYIQYLLSSVYQYLL